MGNRTGNPPEQYRDDEDDESTENKQDTDDRQQTEIGDVTQPEGDGEETSNSDPNVADDPEQSHESGGGGVINVPTESEPDDVPREDDESDEIDQEDGRPESEEESEPESQSEERDDTEDDEIDEFEFIYGDIVQDREAEPPEDEEIEDLIVVNLPDETIADWDCDDDETLADRNIGYPPTDSVVIVVTFETLCAKIPDWDKRHEEIPLETLDDNGIDYSCYPSLRLKLKEPSHLRTL